MWKNIASFDCFLSNISDKYYQNLTILSRVTAKTSGIFFRDTVYIDGLMWSVASASGTQNKKKVHDHKSVTPILPMVFFARQLRPLPPLAPNEPLMSLQGPDNSLVGLFFILCWMIMQCQSRFKLCRTRKRPFPPVRARTRVIFISRWYHFITSDCKSRRKFAQFLRVQTEKQPSPFAKRLGISGLYGAI